MLFLYNDDTSQYLIIKKTEALFKFVFPTQI